MTTAHKNLIIRVDAGGQIGAGHMMRCIALAQAWQDKGGRVVFLTHCESPMLQDQITDEGFNFIPIDKPHPHPSDLHSTLEVLSAISQQISTASPWFALDGYHFTPNFQKAIRENGHKLIVIDDMNHLPHYHADILLNQNIHAESLRYSCDSDTVKLLGCDYVLLRREFVKYRNWERKIPDKATKILLTMGGLDSKNVTLKAIEAINLLNDHDLEVKIVIGSLNRHLPVLQNAALHAPCSMHFILNATDMPDLMAWADVAISSGGSTSWEVAFTGLPNLIITLAHNQVGIANELGKVGAAVELGWHENVSTKQYAQALKKILEDMRLRSSLSEQGKKLVNGKGSQKIIKEMFVGKIELRKPRQEDCKLLWKWVNDPMVRQSAFNSKQITWKEHKAWFSNKLNDPQCVQYIALNGYDVSIGQIRFDIRESVAEIDYSIDKDFRGMGLGKMLLKSGIEAFCAEIEKPITIQGRVKKENQPSNRAFKYAGFLEADGTFIDGNDVTNPRNLTVLLYEKVLFPKERNGLN